MSTGQEERFIFGAKYKNLMCVDAMAKVGGQIPLNDVLAIELADGRVVLGTLKGKDGTGMIIQTGPEPDSIDVVDLEDTRVVVFMVPYAELYGYLEEARAKKIQLEPLLRVWNDNDKVFMDFS